jgi:HSP20 family molecular chaperone IbpA
MDRPKDHNRLVHFRTDWQVSNSHLSFYRSHVHSLFDEIIHKSWGCSHWHPSADVTETEDAFVINVDLPGVEADAVGIEVRGRTLIIHGERQIQPEEKTVQIHFRERTAGDFARAFEFEEELELDSIERSCKDGVLTIVL